MSPPDRVLGDASALMVFGDPASWRAPWEDALQARPGEEDPALVAPALAAWWAGEAPAGAGYSVVVGTDATRSPFRFAAATGATKPPVVLVPDGVVSRSASSWRDAVVAAAGGPGRVVTSLPGEIPNLVVLASAEAPGSLAERLRVLATDPRLAGKTLAVFSLASPVRPDVPARLLEGGTLAAIGLAEIGPVGHDAALERLRRFLAALASAPQGTRPEGIDGPFVWFFRRARRPRAQYVPGRRPSRRYGRARCGDSG